MSTIYFVKDTGDNSDSGTSDSSAWGSPGGVEGNLIAGDTLQLKRGSSWLGASACQIALTSAQSGSSAGAPTTITYYGAGPKPILDANWENVGNFLGIVNGAGLRNALVENLDCRHSGPQSSAVNNGGLLVSFDDSGAGSSGITVQNCDLDGAWRGGIRFQDASSDCVAADNDITDTGNATFDGFTGQSVINFGDVYGDNCRASNNNMTTSGSEGVSWVNCEPLTTASADSDKWFLCNFNYLFMIESSVLYHQASNRAIWENNLAVGSNDSAYTKWGKIDGTTGDYYQRHVLAVNWEGSNEPPASNIGPHSAYFRSNLITGALAGIDIREQNTSAGAALFDIRFDNNTIVDCGACIDETNTTTNSATAIFIRNNYFRAITSAHVPVGSGGSLGSNWTIGPNYWHDDFNGGAPLSASGSGDVIGGLELNGGANSYRSSLVNVIGSTEFRPLSSSSGALALGYTDENSNALGTQFGGLAFVGLNKVVSLNPDTLEITGGTVAYVLTGPPSDAQGAIKLPFRVATQNQFAHEVNMANVAAFRVTM